MLRISSKKEYKNDKDVLFCEIDYFKMLEYKVDNGSKKKFFRFYLDKELSYDEAVNYIENCDSSQVYFENAELLGHLHTPKLEKKIILAPFSWKKITNKEATALLNSVDKFVDENSLHNGTINAIEKKTMEIEMPDEPSHTSKNIIVYDFEVIADKVEIIIGISRHYDPQYLQLIVDGDSLELKEHQRITKIYKSETHKFYSFFVEKNKPKKITAKYKNGNLKFSKARNYKRNEKNLYKVEDQYFQIFKKSILVRGKLSVVSRTKLELKYLGKLRKRKLLSQRLQLLASKALLSNNRILVADRVAYAKDNGEQFYRYLMSQDVKNAYYIIEESSIDYDRLNAEGFKLLKKGSLRHKLYLYNNSIFLTSNISLSRYHYYNTKNYKYFVDLETGKRIFLQHGVAYNDLSFVYNKYRLNIDGFVCSAQKEYEFLKSLDFRDDLIYTGAPRFDLLNTTKDQDYLFAFFTWRQDLKGLNEDSRIEDFKQSTYFKEINRIVSSPLLAKQLKKKGMKLKLLLHPNMKGHEGYFEETDVLEVCNVVDADITELIRDCKMLITDYSSVICDIAYQHKPVAAYEFDKDEFHYSTGLNLEQEGLSRAFTDFNKIEQYISEKIEDDFIISEEQKMQINDFFGYRDQNNSERLYSYVKDNYL